MVVVEDRRHVLRELLVVRELHDHILVHTVVALVVPHAHGGNRLFRTQIELHPLETAQKLEHAGRVRRLVAVHHIFVFARDGLLGRRHLRLLRRQLLVEPHRHHDRRTILPGTRIRLKVVALDLLGRTARMGRRQLKLDGDLVLGEESSRRDKHSR